MEVTSPALPTATTATSLDAQLTVAPGIAPPFRSYTAAVSCWVACKASNATLEGVMTILVGFGVPSTGPGEEQDHNTPANRAVGRQRERFEGFMSPTLAMHFLGGL